MSRHDCARCSWKPTDDPKESPREQLGEHAIASRHLLCRCCWLSLSDETADWFGCESCLTRCRSLLSGIVTMWTDLPHHLGHLTGAVYDSDRPSAADGRPLPGGDVLVLLGPGQAGGSPRRLNRTEAAQPERWWIKGKTGPLTVAEWMQAERERAGREHHTDNLPTDGASVAFTLTTLEDDLRHVRGDHAAEVEGSSARVVAAAARYLDTFMRWAAQHHDAFPDVLSELTELHGRLERATSCHEHVIRSKVECLECGVCLVRIDTQRGLADEFTCPRCGDRYDTRRYALAAIEAQRDELREHWVTPEQAQALLKIPAETIRTWIKRGLVATERDRDGRLVVWFDEIETRQMGKETA